jgi:hypothetical protein
VRGFAVSREQLGGNAWVDAQLARDLRDGAGHIALRKGTVLRESDAAKLLDLVWTELHLVAAGGDDVVEAEAGERLAELAAGPGSVVAHPVTGHWPIEAAHRGILRVSVDALRAVNAIEALAVYTLYDGQVVETGEAVARAKVIPFAVPRVALERASDWARASGGLVAVRPFMSLRIGAVVNESLGARAAARFQEALDEKVTWLGSVLLAPAFVGSSTDAVANGISDMIDRGADVIVVAGSRPKDPLDPAFLALDRLGAMVERRGVPAHPGSLAWLAHLGEIPIVGMPSCGLFSQATVFDLILPRLVAGERIGASELAALGHGGFLTRDMAFRFPPYRPARDRGEVE